VRVERPAVIETTALGAGLLAGLAVGYWSSARDVAAARRVERVFRPQRSARWRRAEIARWSEAIDMLLARGAPRRGRAISSRSRAR
jgi:glycerol kinase